MLLQEAVNSVEHFVQNLDIGQEDQTNMPLAQVRRKSTSMNKKYMLLVEQVQNKGLVVLRPLLVGQADEHVERTSGTLNFETINGRYALQAMVSLLEHFLGVNFHPTTVTLQSGKVAKLRRC